MDPMGYAGGLPIHPSHWAQQDEVFCWNEQMVGRLTKGTNHGIIREAPKRSLQIRKGYGLFDYDDYISLIDF